MRGCGQLGGFHAPPSTSTYSGRRRLLLPMDQLRLASLSPESRSSRRAYVLRTNSARSRLAVWLLPMRLVVRVRPASHSLQHEGEDDDDEEGSLDRVHDDPHQGALEPPRGISEQEDVVDQACRNAPRLMQVIDRVQEPVRDPIAPSEDALHP